MNKQIRQAIENYQAAAEDLVVITKKVYPVGSIQWVDLGGHEFEIAITQHAGRGTPGYIFGMNVNTDKVRRFHVRDVIHGQEVT